MIILTLVTCRKRGCHPFLHACFNLLNLKFLLNLVLYFSLVCWPKNDFIFEKNWNILFAILLLRKNEKEKFILGNEFCINRVILKSDFCIDYELRELFYILNLVGYKICELMINCLSWSDSSHVQFDSFVHDQIRIQPIY